MLSFYCTRCNKTSFSSTSLEYQYSSDCPYCGGEIIELTKDLKLGEIMLLLGYIDREKLQQALELQKELKKRIGEVLLLNSLINSTQLSQALYIQKEVA